MPATYTLDYIHRQWARVEAGEGMTQAIVELETDRRSG